MSIFVEWKKVAGTQLASGRWVHLPYIPLDTLEAIIVLDFTDVPMEKAGL